MGYVIILHTDMHIALIFGTSLFALPLALAVFPQRQAIDVEKLEPELAKKARDRGITTLEFNRGI